MNVSEYSQKNWQNFCIDSTVPDICKNLPCSLGVDEAGRGPVLGPMVYAVCYCPEEQEGKLKELGAADSKTLSEEKREELFSIIQNNNDFVGWSLELISPMYISNCMYERNKVSLNEVSQTAAEMLIRRVIDKGANIQNVFVDTVGDPGKYQMRLQEAFPSLNITVAKKADSIYPSVSAASICAKVARDKALKEWTFPENTKIESWGSGYPGDSVTKNFLVNSLDSVFGFPGIVRFSWSTAEKIIDEKCVPVKWLHIDEEENKADNTLSVLHFFSKKRKDVPDSKPLKIPAKRCFYFTERCLERIEIL